MNQRHLFLDTKEAELLVEEVTNKQRVCDETVKEIQSRCDELRQQNKMLKGENAKLYHVINKLVTMLGTHGKEASEGTVEFVKTCVIPAVDKNTIPPANRTIVRIAELEAEIELLRAQLDRERRTRGFEDVSEDQRAENMMVHGLHHDLSWRP